MEHQGVFRMTFNDFFMPGKRLAGFLFQGTHAGQMDMGESQRLHGKKKQHRGIIQIIEPGNFLADHDVAGKDGRLYRVREGFCLETNFYPNSLKYPQYPQPILKEGVDYKSETVYRFGV